MFSWSETEEKELTLGQQATQNIVLFRKKKEEYLNECLSTLIDGTRDEILYQSSVGSKEASLGIDEHEKKFSELYIGTEGRSKIYKLSAYDRRDLLNRLEEHYIDAIKYPHLKCNQFIRGYGNPKYCIRIQMIDPSEDTDLPELSQE